MFRENAAALVSDRKLLVFVGLVAGFAILGPFGTYDLLAFWPRLIFWSLVIFGIGAVMHLAISLTLTSVVLQPLPWAGRIALGAMIAALPAAALIIFMTGYFFPAPVTAESFPLLWFQVAVVGTLVGLVEYRTPRTLGNDPPAVAMTRLHERLNGPQPSAIISLSMSDHYVEVTTVTDRQMVLMRLGDAIAELDGLEGQRIHRSHWAAAAHMTSLRKQDRKHLLLLSDGRELPVSGSYLDAVTASLASTAPSP